MYAVTKKSWVSMTWFKQTFAKGVPHRTAMGYKWMGGAFALFLQFK